MYGSRRPTLGRTPGELRPGKPTGLHVIVGDEHGRPVRAAGLSSWLRRVAPKAARGRVSIALVSDARVRGLNRLYRRQDHATDVLSFPARLKAQPLETRHNGVSVNPPVDEFLGDIVIARGVARRQARAARHSELTELRVLALHGLLHLLGYDHETDGGRMRRVEQRLRRKGGLREGLIERTLPR
jgi:probable rRNA maturation factor